MYLLRNHRKWQVAVFAVSNIILYAVFPMVTMPNITIKLLCTEAFEWMGAFAAILMLFYNGERGKGNKTFFYWFYPAHIYILCGASYLLYFLMNK